MMSEELLNFLSVEANESIGFNCFPNPSDGDIFIRLDDGSVGPTEIEIYTVMGQKVFSKSCVLSGLENKVTINPDLPAGIYFLKINGSSQKIVRR